MVMDVNYVGEAEMSSAVLNNQVRKKKKGTKATKTKRKGNKKDCGCPK